jgi:hypothetical protein
MNRICVLLLSCFYLSAKAQKPPSDSAFQDQAIRQVISDYRTSAGENLRLFNGQQYIRTSHGIAGSPFFLSDSLLSGTVYYEDRLYTNQALRYDMVIDNVIIPSYRGDNEMQLVPEKLSYFTVLDHAFIRIVADSATPPFITTGYYERLNEGKLILLAKRSKLVQNSRSGNDVTSYKDYVYYYAWRDNKFYRVNDKKELLVLMEDKKPQLNQFIKDNKLKFKKNREADYIELATYYSKL